MDAIDAYLDELARRLRLTPTAARRFLAEAEAHLNDLVDEGIASGTDRTTAEAHAVARFGSSREVARSANGGPLGVLRAAGLATAQLGAAGFAAVIVGTLLAEVLARLTSTAWVFGPPRAWAPTSGQMSHWLRIHPGAGDWRSAAALENAADSLVLRAGLAVVGLAVCLAVFLLLRRFSRLGGGVVPAVGLTAFAGRRRRPRERIRGRPAVDRLGSGSVALRRRGGARRRPALPASVPARRTRGRLTALVRLRTPTRGASARPDWPG